MRNRPRVIYETSLRGESSARPMAKAQRTPTLISRAPWLVGPKRSNGYRSKAVELQSSPRLRRKLNSLNATNSNLSSPLTSPAFSVAPNNTRKKMKAKIETNLECRDGSAVPMQRLQIAWSECIWTAKVSRVSQVKNARPFLVRHSTNIRDKVRSSIQVQSCPFFE